MEPSIHPSVRPSIDPSPSTATGNFRSCSSSFSKLHQSNNSNIFLVENFLFATDERADERTNGQCLDILVMACSAREDDLIIRPSEPSLSRRRRMLLAPIGTVRPKTVVAPCAHFVIRLIRRLRCA